MRKIIWAIDAVHEPGELHEQTVHALEALSRVTGTRIIPVYVLSPAQLDLSVEFSGSWLEHYKPAAQKVLESYIKSVRLKNLDAPTVIIQNRPSLRHAVEALDRFAVAAEAELIVLGTHGRKGAWRLLLGSFAETLLLRSTVPVLTIGPHSKPIADFNGILFPTDFSRTSKNMFKYIVEVTKDLKAKITLYHSVPNLIEPIFQSGVYLFGGAWIPVRNYFDEEVDQRKKHGDAWAKWATKQGVSTEFILDDRGGSISERILEVAARDEIGVIAMASRSGPVSSAMIGSVTRQVVRTAPCPVWVLHNVPTVKSAREKIRKAA